MLPPYCAAEEIGFDGPTKVPGDIGLGVGAENDHVHQILTVVLRGRRVRVAEGAARAEDGLDGAKDSQSQV